MCKRQCCICDQEHTCICDQVHACNMHHIFCSSEEVVLVHFIKAKHNLKGIYSIFKKIKLDSTLKAILGISPIILAFNQCRDVSAYI